MIQRAELYWEDFNAKRGASSQISEDEYDSDDTEEKKSSHVSRDKSLTGNRSRNLTKS